MSDFMRNLKVGLKGVEGLGRFDQKQKVYLCQNGYQMADAVLGGGAQSELGLLYRSLKRNKTYPISGNDLDDILQVLTAYEKIREIEPMVPKVRQIQALDEILKLTSRR